MQKFWLGVLRDSHVPKQMRCLYAQLVLDRLHTNSFGNLVFVDVCFVITVLYCNYCPYCNNALTLPTMSFVVCYSRVRPFI